MESRLTFLELSKNNLEGTIPAHLASLLLYCRHIGILSRAQGPRLRGSLPARLLSTGQMVGPISKIFSGQQLEGAIAAVFSYTFTVLLLRQNAFQSVSFLELSGSRHVKPVFVVLMDQNRLSCRLPLCSRGKTFRPNASLVAVGNHLTWTGDRTTLPSYVLPYERNSLFWYKQDAGMCLLGKILAGGVCLAVVFAQQVGHRSYLDMTQRWHAGGGIHGIMAGLTKATLLFTFSQAIGSCILLLMVARCDYYMCPSTLALASACLLKSSSVQGMVVVIWNRFCCEAPLALCTCTDWRCDFNPKKGARLLGLTYDLLQCTTTQLDEKKLSRPHPFLFSATFLSSFCCKATQDSFCDREAVLRNQLPCFYNIGCRGTAGPSSQLQLLFQKNSRRL